MRRRFLLCLLSVLLLSGAAEAQGISGALRIQDATSGALLRVTHYGGLMVTLFNDPEYWGADRSATISHITGVVHVSGWIRGFGPQGTDVVDLANAALQVNCVVGCSASSGPTLVSHVSSVTHVALAGGVTDPALNAVRMNCVAGCGGSSGPTVVSHVTSATHVSGVVTGFGPQGTNAVDAANAALRVTPVTVVTVMGTIGHLTSISHVAGVVTGFGRQGTDVVDAATGALKVSQSPARWPVSHVTSVTHVTLGFSPRLQAFQVTNCGSTARMIVSSNPSRRSLKVRNVGTLPIWVNGGHVTVSSSNGWTLHAVTTAANTTETSVLELPDFQGQIDCVANGPVKVEVMELLR